MIEKLELCAARGMLKLPLPLYPKDSSPTSIQFQPLLRYKTHFPLLHNHTVLHSGLQYYRNLSLRSTTSEEISTGTTVSKEESKTVDDTQLVENKEDYGSQLNEELQEGSLFDNPLKLFKFLEDLNIKLDYGEAYSFVAFGGGGAVALWLVIAVIDAIDSIPVLPKALELVGLGYTLWFSSRYLVLKKNRDELLARAEQLKQRVLGSEDE